MKGLNTICIAMLLTAGIAACSSDAYEERRPSDPTRPESIELVPDYEGMTMDEVREDFVGKCRVWIAVDEFNKATGEKTCTCIYHELEQFPGVLEQQDFQKIAQACQNKTDDEFFSDFNKDLSQYEYEGQE